MRLNALQKQRISEVTNRSQMNNKNTSNKAKELLKACRYFDGSDREREDLPGDEAMLCYYEKWWYERSLQFYETGEIDGFFESVIDQYKYAGLEHFAEEDQRPITLKALLFNRYGYTLSANIKEQAELFQIFYLKHYSRESSRSEK